MNTWKTKIMATVLLFLLQTEAFADEYVLSIQPILSKSAVLSSYQPLASYLSEQTGHTITIKSYRNFFTYWQKMKKSGNFDLVLDAAHFTDYRIKNKNYTVLAKLPATVSFTLVTHEDFFVFDTEELVNKKIASMVSPGLGGIRLYEIFSNPAHLPNAITVDNATAAIDAVAEGKVDAAIVPTPLLNKYDFLNTVITTAPVPHMAISASANVPENVQLSIRNALIDAGKTKSGQVMLEQLGIGEFEKTNAKEYAGYSELLKDVFGYKSVLSAEN